MKKLEFLVIHCTDTPAGRNVSSDDIRQWHLSPPPDGRGWKQVGYSDMVHLDGVIENLVPYNNDDWVDPREITNGVAGMNSKSRHIVYVGGGEGIDTRTPEQTKVLTKYVKDLIIKYPKIIVLGHNQVSSKLCPSFDVSKWLGNIGVSQINMYK
jgi:hypothetical protein